MIINGISYILPCCSHAESIKTPYNALKHKIEHTWNAGLLYIKNQYALPIQPLIQEEIDKLDKIQATETKPLYISALRRAFAHSMANLIKAQINPIALPKQIAFQMTETLCRFGIAIYGSKDVAHPFHSSLDVLRTALLMQEYALGLRDACPDLSNLLILDDLYTNPGVYLEARQLTEVAIDRLDPEVWSAKTLMLSQNQLLLMPELLRYINGAMRYLKQATLPHSRRLLETAEACLIAAQKKTFFDQSEVNNHLAELKYNDISGLLATQIQDFEEKDQVYECIEAKQKLRQLWDDCISLSKDPEQMRARCDNKRIFIEKLSPEQQLELSRNALDRHLSLPRERQNITLIALAHHNLSHSYERANDIKNAIKHAKEALVAVGIAKSQGENNVQFDNAFNHAKALAESYGAF